MSDVFLARLMVFALETTGAERGMAVNRTGEVIALEGLTEQDIQQDDFKGFQNIEQALHSTDAPFITNNMLLDSDSAPSTNTNFANLRLVVIFPLGDLGLIYVDQHVRRGVVNQAVAKRVQQAAEQLIDAGHFAASKGDIAATYEALG